MSRLATLLAAFLAALTLAACADPSSVGQDPAPTTSPTPSPAYAADDVVLRVSFGGGLAPDKPSPELPYWTLYGDGRVVTRGPEPAIYPGQALPNLRVAQLAPGGVDNVVKAAREAGVDGVERDYGDPPVADASTTTFLLGTADGTVVTKVYALQESDDLGNDARKKLLAFHRRLTAADGLGPAGPDAAYEPAAVAVYATPYRAPDTQIEVGDVAWTGADPATGQDTRAGRCLVLRDAALAQAMPAFRKANTLTRWHADGTAWAFALRPLLPDESTCADGLT